MLLSSLLACCGLLAVPGCGGSTEQHTCCEQEDLWDSTATWPEQSEHRRTRAAAAAAKFSPEELRKQGVDQAALETLLVDGLRGVAVTRVEPGPLAVELAAEPWRARLLRRGPRMSGPAASVGELEAELLRCMGSRERAALVRESAVRASLAQAMVQEAILRAMDAGASAGAPSEAASAEAPGPASGPMSGAESRVSGGESPLETQLRAALAVVEDSCQVPEAILNRAAIRLELARLAEARGGDGARSAIEHEQGAQSAIAQLLFADATSCGESRGEFFGSPGVGRRFVYVLDKSSSMDVPGGFDELRRQVGKTLEELPPDTSFSVLFFSEPPSRRSGGTRMTYSEVPVAPAQDDGTGMFLRERLGERGSGGALDELLRSVDAVVPNGRTEPADALERALALQPSSIFLLTDGVIDTDEDRLLRIAAKARDQGAVINTVLFFSVAATQAGQPPAVLGEGLDKLQQLARETGGSVVVATQRQGIGTLAIAQSASKVDLQIPGRYAETLIERMKRRGYWTPEAARQFAAIASELEVRRGDLARARALIEEALRAAIPEPDIVTSGESQPRASSTWPRLQDDAPVPADPALLLESAMLAHLDGDQKLAAERFDAAARVWAHCAQLAERAGRSEDAATFADLGCRALLLGALSHPASAEHDPRSAEAAGVVLGRAGELGLARAGGWCQLLLAAGAGPLSNLKAGVQHDLSDADPQRAVELELVRGFYRRAGEVPLTGRFTGFPTTERLFLTRIADSIRVPETP